MALKSKFYFSVVCRKHDLIVLSDEIYGICGFNNHKNISFSKVRRHLAKSINLRFLSLPEKNLHIVLIFRNCDFIIEIVFRARWETMFCWPDLFQSASMGCLNDYFLVLQGRDHCLFGNIEMVRWWRLETWIHDCTKRAQSLITGES